MFVILFRDQIFQKTTKKQKNPNVFHLNIVHNSWLSQLVTEYYRHPLMMKEWDIPIIQDKWSVHLKPVYGSALFPRSPDP